MRRDASSLCGVLLAFGFIALGVGCAAIDAGHEGVLVEQPLFFGHGGVDPVPTKTGRLWVSPTTRVIDV
ncbi:MAG: hypothetical protein H8J66_12255, partial [Nitrospira sp.]|nr:hypothetical protein [Nitrospira sp.]